MEPIKVTLYEPVQAHKALWAAWLAIKPMVLGGHRLLLSVTVEIRNGKQNAKLHAMLGEIAAQIEWAGKKRDTETWKRLVVAAWCRARGEQIEILPAIDGHGVDIVFRRTSELTKAECAELIEYTYAWGAEHGVEFWEPMQVDPETGEIFEATA